MSTQDAPTIGLYGGSFDPPHMAHVLVCAWALATGEVDAVWVMPTGGHPFGKQLTPYAIRRAMLERAFGWAGERVRIIDAENEERVHYTVETLERLAAQHPGHRWRWIMGSDTWADADKWKDFDRIREMAPPLVIPRRGSEDSVAAVADFALPDVSSTAIRRHLGEGGEAEALAPILPGGVRELIEKHRLYRDPSGPEQD